MDETQNQIPEVKQKKKSACSKGGHARWKGTTKAQRQAEARRIRSFGTNGAKREEVGPVREFLRKSVKAAFASKNPKFIAQFPEGVNRVSIVREVVTLHPAPIRVPVPKDKNATLLGRTKAKMGEFGI